MSSDYRLIWAEQKVQAIESSVSKLFDIEFPYNDTRDALAYVQGQLSNYKAILKLAKSIGLDNIESLSTFQKALGEIGHGLTFAERLLSLANFRAWEYLPILGAILRSTNIRNNFEVYEPLLDVSRKLIGPYIKLIISSDWEYSPLIYTPNIDFVDQFVLIGLPAQEANNPLILPLAGHELGHSLWNNMDLENPNSELSRQILANAQIAVDDKYASHPGKTKANFRLRISEMVKKKLCELFCDYVGLWIFHDSFLHAFEYLLSPSFLLPSSETYPPLSHRARYLSQKAPSVGADVPPGFEKRFADPVDESSSSTVNELANITNEIVKDLNDFVFSLVKERFETAEKDNQLLSPSKETKQRVYESYKSRAPFDDTAALGDLINGGLRRYRELILRTEDVSSEKSELFNLIYKSMEIMELRHMISKQGAS